MSQRVYILGGHQTDFANNYSKRSLGLFDIMKDTVEGALQSASVDPRDIEVAHVGNFAGELFCQQGQLGGFFAALDDAFHGLPTSRHEAACASGGVSVLAAAADIEAGRYDLACVVGVEQEKNVGGSQAAEYLGAAAWVGREANDAKFPWPHLFDRLAQEYERRYGLDLRHLRRIGELNFGNGRRNPNAQTRRWEFSEQSFSEDESANPTIEGSIRRQDCSQLTDGGAAIFLASAEFKDRWAARCGVDPAAIPYIQGWGHRTATMLFDEKLARSKDESHVFPEVRATIQDAWRRAGIASSDQLSGVEVHDCFTITEYMAIDHFGITAPGKAYRAIEDGTIEFGGRLPINPSGGLIGGGHPVGASGVRMVLDAHKQVTGGAGDYQVPGARRFQTLNIGGTTTTSVSFVIGNE